MLHTEQRSKCRVVAPYGVERECKLGIVIVVIGPLQKPTKDAVAKAVELVNTLTKDEQLALGVGKSISDLDHADRPEFRLVGFVSDLGQDWTPPAGTIAFFGAKPDQVVIKPKAFQHSALCSIGVRQAKIWSTSQLTTEQLARIDKLDDFGDINLRSVRSYGFETVDPQVWLLKYAEDLYITTEPKIEEALTANDAVAAMREAQSVGGTDELRRRVCADPYLAYEYALDVDEGPHHDTRTAASQLPDYAVHYAIYIDKGPHPDTRAGACKLAATASRYATEIDGHLTPETTAAIKNDRFEHAWLSKLSVEDWMDLYKFHKSPKIDEHLIASAKELHAVRRLTIEENATRRNPAPTAQDRRNGELAVAKGRRNGPRDEDREIACRTPVTACAYAEAVDRGPHDATRAAACASPEMAEWYAEFIDRGPRDDTRTAACANPEWAFEYASRVDRCARDDTREAACRSLKSAQMYVEELDGYPHPTAVARWGRAIATHIGKYSAMPEPTVESTRDLLRRICEGEPKIKDPSIEESLSGDLAWVNQRGDAYYGSDYNLRHDGLAAEIIAQQEGKTSRDLLNRDCSGELLAAGWARVSWDEYAYDNGSKVIYSQTIRPLSVAQRNWLRSLHDETGLPVVVEAGKSAARRIFEAEEVKGDRAWVSQRGKAVYGDDSGLHHDELAVMICTGKSESELTANDLKFTDYVRQVIDAGWARVAWDPFVKTEQDDRFISCWTKHPLSVAQRRWLKNLHETTGLPVRSEVEGAAVRVIFGDLPPMIDDEGNVVEDQSATHSPCARLLDELVESGEEDLVNYLDPEEAYWVARQSGGTDLLRVTASRWGEYAYLYARYVDRGPHPATRIGACRTAEYAFWYALEIDHRPTPETHAAVQQDPAWANRYAEAEQYPERWLRGTRSAEPTVESVLSPIKAYHQASQSGGSDELRRLASADPNVAVEYAFRVDKCPHPVTRTGACATAEAAWDYALEVDGYPTPETLAAVKAKPALFDQIKHVLDKPDFWTNHWRQNSEPKINGLTEARRQEVPQTMSALEAFDKACKTGGTDELRTIACSNPSVAYHYAREVDGGPHDATREAASKNPTAAVEYAWYVDKGPHPVTRAGACGKPVTAYDYALEIDGYPTPEILAAIEPDAVLINRIKDIINHPAQWSKQWRYMPEPTSDDLHEATWRRLPGERADAVYRWLDDKISAAPGESRTQKTNHLHATDPGYGKIAQMLIARAFDDGAERKTAPTGRRWVTAGQPNQTDTIQAVAADWSDEHGCWVIDSEFCDLHVYSLTDSLPLYLLELNADALQAHQKTSKSHLNLEPSQFKVIKQLHSSEWFIDGCDPSEVRKPIEPRLEPIDEAKIKIKITDPTRAYLTALHHGSTAALRKVASLDPHGAYHYAIEIDKGPHPVTRSGAAKNPTTACLYATDIDRYPHPELVAAWPGKISVDPTDYDLVEPVVESTAAPVQEAVKRQPGDEHCTDSYLTYCNAMAAVSQARRDGGTDELRRLASQHEAAAYHYALSVDGGPHPVTWAGVSKNFEYATYYAKYIDRYPRQEYINEWPDSYISQQTAKDWIPEPTIADEEAELLDESHNGAVFESLTPEQRARDAYYKAAVEGPSDDTRRIASIKSDWAYLYAYNIDKGPHPVTRDSACNSVGSAVAYALHVDRYPHPDLVAHWGTTIPTGHASYEMNAPKIKDDASAPVPNLDGIVFESKDIESSKRWSRRVGAKPKACWRNAVRTTLRGPDSFSYVEGFVRLPRFNNIVVEHGWVQDGDKIIDPTLPDDADAVYFPGVSYTKAEVQKLSDQHEAPFVWGGKNGFGGYGHAGYKAAFDNAWSAITSNQPK